MNDLMLAFSSNITNLNSRVIQWSSSYQKNKNQSFFDIIEVIYFAAGVNLKKCKVEYEEGGDILLKPVDEFIVELFTKHSVEKYVSGKQIKNIGEIIYFIFSINNGILFYEKELINYLLTTLARFSRIKLISFQLTAAIIAQRMLLVLTQFICRKSEQSIEPKHKADSTVTEGNKRLKFEIDILQNHFMIIMREVFSEMRKNPEKEIRSYCHQLMELWVKFTSKNFFVGTYFNLFYCFLCDPDEQLRRFNLKNYLAVLNKYEYTDIHLSEKFYEIAIRRLLRLMFDPSIDVRVFGLKCLSVIDRKGKVLFRNEHLSRIYQLVYHQQGLISRAAGGFLHNRIIKKVGLNDSNEYKENVVSFHIEAMNNSDVVTNDDYLIDSLCNKTIMLSDWDSWILLIMDTSKDDYESDDNEDTSRAEIIIRLMVSSLKIYTTGMIPFNRILKENKTVSSSSVLYLRKNATFHFVEKANLINICHKYERKYQLFCLLLSCFSYLNYSDLNISCQILQFVRYKCFMNQENIAIVNECSKTYSMIVSKLIKEKKLVFNYQSSSEEEVGTEEDEEEDLRESVLSGARTHAARLDDICHNLLANEGEKIEEVNTDMMRFLALSSVTDVMEHNIWINIFKHLKFLFEEAEGVTIEVEHLFLRICFMNIFWIGLYFTEDSLGEKEVDGKFLKILNDDYWPNLFYDLLKSYLTTEHLDRKRKIEDVISDLEALSSYLKEHNGIHSLIYE